MMEIPEYLQTCQSFTFDINNHVDGKVAVLTFFALPNASDNPENSVIARFALPYDAFAAIPEVIQNLIKENDKRFPAKIEPTTPPEI